MVKKRKKNKKRNWPFVLIFIVGLLILLYPRFSMWYYRIDSNNIIKVFDSEKSKLTSDEIQRRMELAKGYNLSLNNVIGDDPYDDIIVNGRKEYARMLQIKEYIGHIQIPKIKEDIPMYAGTTEEVLQKGAGHLEGTSLPIGGENTHSVITAHTGLPTAKLFTNLDKVEIGDKFYVHNFAEILAYEVDQIKVVEPSNFNDLLIVKDKDYVTLLTCTPYMINTHRLLVRGHRVEYVPEVANREMELTKLTFFEKYFIYILILLVILLLVLYYLYSKRKKNKNKKKVEN